MPQKAHTEYKAPVVLSAIQALKYMRESYHGFSSGESDDEIKTWDYDHYIYVAPEAMRILCNKGYINRIKVETTETCVDDPSLNKYRFFYWYRLKS